MTVPENNKPKITYEGPYDIGAALPIPFQYAELEDVRLSINETPLEFNIGYSVLGQTATLKVPVAKGDTVTVYRRTPLDQQAVFPQNKRFDSLKMNESLDKVCLQQQEQNEILIRTLKVPISTNVVFDGDLPPLQANKALKVNSDASGFIYTEIDADQIGQEAIKAAERAKVSAEEAEASNIAAGGQAQAAADKAQEAINVVNGFDAHAAEVQNNFDINAATLTARYDNNDLAKTNAFNQNAAEKQALVDASADAAKLSEENAKKYANGTIEEYPDGSSKYWADKAGELVGTGVIADDQIGLDTTYSSSKIEAELEKKKNKTITILKNPINDGYYLEGNENANTIYNYVYGDKTSVELAFDDIITNTGEQIYPFETFDKDRNAIFRRNIITKDKVERINIKVNYQGTVTFESIPFEGGSGSGHMVGELVPFPVSTKYTPEGFIKPDGTEFTEGLFPDLYREYLTDHRWFDRSKVEVVGTPTITDDGIASGFSVSNAINTKLGRIDFSKKSFKIYCKFNTGNISQATTDVCLYGNIFNNRYCPQISLNPRRKNLFSGVGISNGSSWGSFQPSISYEDNTDYYLFQEYNVNTKVMTVGLSKDGINYEERSATINGDTYWVENIRLGNDQGGLPFTGSIDLKQFSISVDGKEVYSPTANTLDTCTYEEYANEVNTYGACAKWAVDDVRNTFKVPFIPSGYYLKNGDGTVNKAGLPNITGDVMPIDVVAMTRKNGKFKGAFKVGEQRSGTVFQNVGAGDNYSLGFDASLSNPIYGASDTVEANAVAVQWFIYVANAQIGQSAIDWSRITEAVESRAKTDLSNITDKLDDSFYDKLQPDFTSGIAIPVNIALVAPTSGWVIGLLGVPSSGVSTLKVNGNIVCYSVGNSPYYDIINFCSQIVYKNDNIIMQNTDKSNVPLTFYPMKGAK